MGTGWILGRPSLVESALVRDLPFRFKWILDYLGPRCFGALKGLNGSSVFSHWKTLLSASNHTKSDSRDEQLGECKRQPEAPGKTATNYGNESVRLNRRGADDVASLGCR